MVTSVDGTGSRITLPHYQGGFHVPGTVGNAESLVVNIQEAPLLPVAFLPNHAFQALVYTSPRVLVHGERLVGVGTECVDAKAVGTFRRAAFSERSMEVSWPAINKRKTNVIA